MRFGSIRRFVHDAGAEVSTDKCDREVGPEAIASTSPQKRQPVPLTTDSSIEPGGTGFSDEPIDG